MQKAIIVLAYWNGDGEWKEAGMDEVNELLSNGWKVVSATPMGGASYGYSSRLADRHYSFGDRDQIAFTSMMILEQKD